MPFAVSGRITGLDEVLGRLRGLDRKLRKKALRDAVNQASKIVLWAARARVPTKTKLLYRSLGRKVKAYRNSGAVVAIVGPRVGFKQAVTREGRVVLSNPTKYAHLVEKGTVRSRAFPFLRPAFEDSMGAARTAMFNVLSNAVEDAGRAA